jgi:HK97 family phage prohead protease
MSNGPEYRSAPTKVDVSTSGNTTRISGMPIAYDVAYKVRDTQGEFHETMRRGSVSHLLKDPGYDCKLLVNHDTNGIPLASSASGTLKLKDTDRGLTFTADLAHDSPQAMNLLSALRRKDINKMSIGMIVGQDTWTAGGTQRTISRLDDLLEVSAVSWPCSTTTSIGLDESRARINMLSGRGGSVQQWQRILEAASRGKTPGPRRVCKNCHGSGLAGTPNKTGKQCPMCSGKGVVSSANDIILTAGDDGSQGGNGSGGSPMGGNMDATGSRAALETARQELVMGSTFGRAPSRAQVARMMEVEADIARRERLRRRTAIELELITAGRR